VQVHRNIHTLIQETFKRYKTNTQSSSSVPSRGQHKINLLKTLVLVPPTLVMWQKHIKHLHQPFW